MVTESVVSHKFQKLLLEYSELLSDFLVQLTQSRQYNTTGKESSKPSNNEKTVLILALAVPVESCLTQSDEMPKSNHSISV